MCNVKSFWDFVYTAFGIHIIFGISPKLEEGKKDNDGPQDIYVASNVSIAIGITDSTDDLRLLINKTFTYIWRNVKN